MNLESYKEAKNAFLAGDFSTAQEYFEQNGFVLEYAYCRLLSGDSEGAKKAFLKISKFDSRADWGEKLTQFIDRYVKVAPSYFQIRNFLEIDLNMLIQAGQAQFVENIINGADLLYSVNPESYKFIARVMFFNGYTDLALYYLNKAKDKFYYDPEMHFMLANCYLKKGEKAAAIRAINSCLSILPNYFPAKNLLDKIQKD